MKLILDNCKEIVLQDEIAQAITKQIEENSRTRNFSTGNEDESFYIEYDGAIYSCYEDENDNDIKAFNSFTNKEYAEKIAFKQLVERKLLAFKDKYDSIEIDWSDNCQFKWFIGYIFDIRKLYTYCNLDICHSIICFSSEKLAQKAINTYKEDLEKYFNLDL